MDGTRTERIPRPPTRRKARGQAPGKPNSGSGPEFGFTLEGVEPRIRRALETDRTIDITTTGRTTGRPHRIEMWFHHLDGRLYLTGTPGARSWHANLLAHPDFVFHLKSTVRADLPARATPIARWSK